MNVRSTLRTLWRRSLWLTAPLAVIVVALALEVVPRYRTFGVDHYIRGREEEKLWEFMQIEAQRLVRRTVLAFKPADRERPLRQVHLYLEPEQRSQLNSDLPFSGREYVAGRLRYPDQRLEDVRVRYRGDFWWHWAFYKKSMRIRTSKRQLFDGMRAFNLIAPKFPAVANNHLAYRLADTFGLMTPHSEMVNVWLNDRVLGVHVLVEQPSELTLERHGRMPGDLFRGEMVARDGYIGIYNSLFRHARVWQHIARAPGEGASHGAMERFIEILNRDHSQSDLTELFEPEVWGRFFAFEVLAQSDHFDNLHNWRLFYDPWRDKFEPMIWDSNGWHPRLKPEAGELWQFDFRASHLHDVLLGDARFLQARQTALEDFFERELDEQFFAEVDSVLTAVDQEVADDANFVAQFEYWTPREIRERTKILRHDITQLFQQVRKEYLFSELDLAWSDLEDGKLRVRINSRRGFDALRVRFDRDLSGPSALVTSGMGKDVTRVELGGSTGIRGPYIEVAAPWMARFVPIRSGKGGVRSRIFEIQPAVYTVEFPGAGEGARVEKVWGIDWLQRRVEASQDDSLHSARVAAPVQFAAPIEAQQRWQGEVTIEGTRVESGPVSIAPGTTIWLQPDASLIFAGRVTAEGTAQQPVRFLARQPEAPWGAVAFQGPGADGSRLNHCEISGGKGGSIAEGDRAERYPAMFSVIDAEEIEISDCRLQGHRDAVEVVRTVYAEVEISRTSIGGIRQPLELGSVAAGVAFHRSRAHLRDVRVSTHSGHGIDAVGSRVSLTGSRVDNVGDRGVLAREDSELVVIDSLLATAAIAAESRDESKLWLFNSTLRHNGLGMHADHRNWRFERGGKLWFYHGLLADERVATIGKRARIVIASSELAGELESTESITVQQRVEQPIDLPSWASELATRIDSKRQGWSGDAP